MVGNKNSAVEKYRAFLAAPGGDLKARQKAEESLTALTKIPDSPPHPPPAAATPVDAAPRSVTTAGDNTFRTAGWISLVVGALAGAGGTALYFAGKGDHDQITGAPGFAQSGQIVGMTQVRAQQLADSGRTKQISGGALLSVAGVAAAVGIGFLVIPLSARDRALSVGLVQTLSGGELMVRGGF